MTNEEAIEILCDVGDINRCCAEDAEALDIAIEALEQEPYGDCISRQEAIDIVEDMHDLARSDVLSDTVKQLRDLPSVQPTRPTGKWIPVSKRLPDKLKDVVVCFYEEDEEFDVAYLRTTFNATYKQNGAVNEWVSSMGETTYADYEVLAWMPIETYKEEKDEDSN